MFSKSHCHRTCKEANPGFEGNVAAIINQGYKNFSVIFVTGFESDPAYPILQKTVSQVQSRTLVLEVAGRTQNCSQKIYNLLAGLKKVADNCEVLVFADSDIRPHKNWLRNLIVPLYDKNVGPSTSYRWYMPMPGNFWSAVRSVWNMTSANLLFNERYNFAWGGSMAIKKETFHEFEIARKWQRALSDDVFYLIGHRDNSPLSEFMIQSCGN